MKRKLCQVIIFLLIMGAGMGGTIFAVAQLARPTLKTAEVGISGGISIQFPKEMSASSVEFRLAMAPEQATNLEWDGTLLTIWPETAWQPEAEITITLKGGSEFVGGGRLLHDWKSIVKVREPGILYLSPYSKGSLLWRLKGDEAPVGIGVEQTGVLEAAISTDGNRIAYSLGNNQGGSDIWIVDSIQKKPRLLMDCGKSVCLELNWQPRKSRIAYSHYLNGVQGIPTVQTVDADSGDAAPFFSDSSISGQFPAFSPDGLKLAVFSPSLDGIYLQDLGEGSSSVLQTSIPQLAVWAPDGKKLYFLRSILLADQPVDKLYSFNIENGQISLVLGAEDDSLVYGTPAWNPDGSLLAVPVRSLGGGYSSQIWLMAPNGTMLQELTDDPEFSHGGLTWRPDGHQLLFQRFMTNASGSPEVLVWDRLSGRVTRLAEDAYGAKWLP
jgi:Tol biopolymer transport system component